MKTSEFIRECAIAYNYNPRPRNGRKVVASVVWDGETLYSYGTHYPLLFKLPAGPDQVNGRGFFWICNDRGHSNTTAKHIGQARQYSDFNVQLIGHRIDAANIIESATQEISRIDSNIAATLEKEIQRPHYAHVYRKSVATYETRKQHLNDLLIAARAAQLLPGKEVTA